MEFAISSKCRKPSCGLGWFVARFYAAISVKKTYEISGAAVKQANPRPGAWEIAAAIAAAARFSPF